MTRAPWAPVGQCATCGKRCYRSKSDAKAARRSHAATKPGHLAVYRCGNYWHLGHLPAPVVAGDQSRAGIYTSPSSNRRRLQARCP